MNLRILKRPGSDQDLPVRDAHVADADVTFGRPPTKEGQVPSSIRIRPFV